MKVSDFDYNLPEELIAQHPPKIRGTSNLLVLDRKTGKIHDKKYSDIVDYLNQGDVLVLNDTKVMKARLIATKANGVKRELVILEKHGKNGHFKQHKVLYRGKISENDELFIKNHRIIVDKIIGGGIALVSSGLDLIELSNQYGKPPLPPYMKRQATKNDIDRYQTVFARNIGSAAAPTASLNMTKEIINKLQEKGVKICYITLHVGLGTFLPIRTKNVEDHPIHSEYFYIPKTTFDIMNKAKNNGNKVVALGTTVARTLEYMATCHPTSLQGEANIFIYPGYEFKYIDSLITNFHAPRSTVLMLTSAFAGIENLENVYAHAVDHKYAFLSYGDSMLIQ